MLSALISRAYCIPSLEASQLIKPTNSEHSYYANPTGSGTKQRQCVCIWEMYHWLMWKLCRERIFPHDEDVDKSRPYFAVVECLQLRDRSAHCVRRQELVKTGMNCMFGSKRQEINTSLWQWLHSQIYYFCCTTQVRIYRRTYWLLNNSIAKSTQCVLSHTVHIT